MRLVAMTCPTCGAHINIPAGHTGTHCQFCGAQVYVDDEVQRVEQHIRYDNAEDAGYSFEKGRIRAQQESGQDWQQSPYGQQGKRSPQTVQAPEPKRSTRRTVLWVLGWLFCFPIPLTILLVNNKEAGKKALWILGWLLLFPVPLTILMLRKKDMDPTRKRLVIAGGWLAYLLLAVLGSCVNGGSTAASRVPSRSLTEPVVTTEQRLENTDDTGSGEPTEETRNKSMVELSPEPTYRIGEVKENTDSGSSSQSSDVESTQVPQIEEQSQEPVANQGQPVEQSDTQTNEQPAQQEEPQPEPASEPQPQEQQVPISDIVYTTPNGKSYHRRRSCPSLSRSSVVNETTLDEAINNGHGDPCDRCAL